MKVRIVSRPLLLCGLGIVVGLLSSSCLLAVRQLRGSLEPHQHANADAFKMAVSNPDGKRLVLVGIMTAAKYVDSRAYNVWRTWAHKIPGKVLFFVAENTVSQYPDMPLIRLKGVDDTYPPQKKSFAMVRWMFDNYIDHFDWFMRADDDLYVKGDLLESFLRSLDSSKAHFIGQAGLGNSAEYGQLSLGVNDNYCMGGPGVIMSKETLKSVAPYLQGCLSELMTTHEDVELGRCIRKHVGVACTWNYEMQTLFHNNQTVPKAYTEGAADEINKAITLHPIKDPAVMVDVHVAVHTLRLQRLQARKMELQRLIKNSVPSLTRRVANKTNDLQIWDYLAFNKISFCANLVTCPRHTVDMSVHSAIKSIVTQLFDEFNLNARQRGRILQFQSIQYGYTRVEPRHGVDYVLDMILWFKKFRPPHRATLSVRRHAYIQQTFGPPEAKSDNQKRKEEDATRLRRNGTAVTQMGAVLRQRLHFIMPLKGRATTFMRFAENLSRILPSNDNSHFLVLILYRWVGMVYNNMSGFSSDNEIEDATIEKTAIELNQVLPVKMIRMGRAEFSRGQALAAGVATLADDDLMFFTDVDMLFTFETVQRIRLNTIRNLQVYFPIVFSEFSPRFWHPSDRNEPSHQHFSYARQKGYFRHFGYGLVSIYKSDFMRVGGFDLSIKGWGMEDVDLFEKTIVDPQLRVFRAPDPGLVHVFHEIFCPVDIPPSQRHMCLGSQAASMASLDSLAEHFTNYA